MPLRMPPSEMTVALATSADSPANCLLGAVFPLKYEDKGDHPALHCVDWSLEIGLGEMAKLGFQTNYGRFTKHTAVFSPASVAEGCSGYLELLAYELSSQSHVPNGLRDLHVVLLLE